MMQILIRFLVGGVVVSFFAFLGDFFKPKSFAGLFGAAPSVAIATLGLALLSQGKPAAIAESRAMIGGAIAFWAYASAVSHTLITRDVRPSRIGPAYLLLWFAVALAMWFAWVR